MKNSRPPQGVRRRRPPLEFVVHHREFIAHRRKSHPSQGVRLSTPVKNFIRRYDRVFWTGFVCSPRTPVKNSIERCSRFVVTPSNVFCRDLFSSIAALSFPLPKGSRRVEASSSSWVMAWSILGRLMALIGRP
ncbi:FAD binding domain-containing protein [Sesbania bispinosa]|nr:FAD binding domain-containing protein [Sesbania bispinosa]